MAFRQPFRSGLRDLAEGLLRQAQSKKESERRQQQLEMQASQQQAQGVQNFGNMLASGMQQAGQQYTEQKRLDEARALQEQERLRAVAEARGERAVNLAAADLARADENLAAMTTFQGSDPAAIEAQQALVNRLRGVVNAPLTEASDMYREVMGGNIVPAMFDIPTPREQAIGRGPQELREGVTGAEALVEGAGAVAALRRSAGTEDQVVANILQNLTTFDVDDPASLIRADAAIRNARGLPSYLRIPMESQIAATEEALATPEAQQRLAEAKRRGTADTLTAEEQARATRIAADRAERDLAWFEDSRPFEFQRLRREANAQDFDAVMNAYSSGNLTSLTDEQRGMLADFVGEENLDMWAQDRVQRNERLLELESEAAEIQQDLSEQKYEVGEVTLSLTETRRDREKWQADREQFMAVTEDRRAAAQDETMIATGLLNAANNGDPETVAFYMAAFENGNSPLGQQMRAFGIEQDELVEFYETAERRQAIDMERLENDLVLQRAQIDTARRDLAMREQLDPLQIAALTAEYIRDERLARSDLDNMAFRNAADAIQTAGEFAQAVPPEFWDNLPPQIARRFQELGINSSYFQTISTHADWLRKEPQRQRGWNMLESMMQASPATPADQAMMLDGVREAVEMMGFEDPVQEAAFLSSAMSVWAAFDADDEYRLLSLAAQAANGAGGGMDPVDIKRVLDGYSSAASTIRQRSQEMLLDIGAAGCATVWQDSSIAGPRYSSPKPRDTPAEGHADGVSCGDLWDNRTKLLEQHDAAVSETFKWAGVLGGEVPNDLVGGETPPPDGNAGPGASSGEPVPTGAQTQGSTTISPMDTAKFTEAVNLLNSGNREQFNDLYRELTTGEGAYSEEVADAYIRRLQAGE